jgi:hypothetical protein
VASVLRALTSREHPGPSRQLRWDVDDLLAGGDEPVRDVPPDPIAALHGPGPLRPLPSVGEHRGEPIDVGGEPAAAEHALVAGHHLDRDAAFVRVHADHDRTFLDVHDALPSPRTS